MQSTGYGHKSKGLIDNLIILQINKPILHVYDSTSGSHIRVSELSSHFNIPVVINC